MAIGAGPMYKLNPSISMFAVFDDEIKIEEVWNKLIEGGKELMPFQTYPWANKYGWLQDKFGMSWQLSMSGDHKLKQTITPMLMFTGEVAGKANEAIKTYTEIFPDSKLEMLVPYDKNDGDKEGYLKHSRFSLSGFEMMAMDSSHPHEFGFNEAVSFIVSCETQEEVDYFWSMLSAVPEAEQCGWLKDKYGVSWQIVPTAMNKMMSSGTPEQIGKVTQAFLKMKKFNISELERAFSS